MDAPSNQESNRQPPESHLVPTCTSSPAKPKRKPSQRREHLRSGLVLPKQPSQLAKNSSEKANELRRELEDACQAAHGEISKTQRGLILSAVTWYRHYLHVSQRMRKDYDLLTAREWLEFSKAACHASNERDRCVAALRLDSPGDAASDDLLLD